MGVLYRERQGKLGVYIPAVAYVIFYHVFVHEEYENVGPGESEVINSSSIRIVSMSSPRGNVVRNAGSRLTVVSCRRYAFGCKCEIQ